ncbi:MAG: DNA polymerase III [Candidatus Wildermuthbacteria bacterium RIFCSPLOWO2_02_FULL_47_9c]|uniref:DNA polymerase beta n=1 Tax=Candidatus Wildermuthbacteria bacterium RIFCSPLOWO2_02_FULL_47_9c TaxID=1802466 RepID=A0A1G2RWY0_9BACT|nr:MAG: DNA polymerase III [Candidatus Wildermuthbacteria bacterium RIFCSPLOWO2_02_FULL_47_9c]
MRNKELAKIFSRLAQYLAMRDIPFKPQAYERASLAIESLAEDVQDIYEREGTVGLEKIPGVGKGIAERIEEYLKTGKVQDYEKERKRMPVDLDELTSVEGIGPKAIAELYKRLKVKNLKDLEKAASAGKIRKLARFGVKTEQNILQGIALVKQSSGRRLISDIFPYVQEYITLLKNSSLAKEVEAAGSFRRMQETVGDIDILATSNNPQKLTEFFLAKVKHTKMWGKGSTKVSVRTQHGFDVDLRVLNEETFGAGLQYFTGSKEHNVKLRTLAIEKEYKVSEYGVFKGKKRVACKTEEEVYRALGLPYIEPELREDTGEIEAALRQAQGKPPGLPKIIPYDSLQGDLQVQTNWTDGEHSIEDMAKEAKRQGLSYIAITDHTKDLAMTGGSDEKRLLKQMAEIDRVNKRVSGITVLKGAEVNIRKDGTLDIADEMLAKLDVVGAAVHSLFKLPKKEMTARLIRAMRNRHVDILFHPTGRLIQKREPYEVDIDEVIKAAKRTGTLLEINAFPTRLDLRDANIRKAVEMGALLVIDSDAHRKEHFSVLRYGIAQARRGWAEAKDIANTLPLKTFLRALKK